MSDNVNRLLIVDDEPGVVDFITAAAHQLDYTVASAGTAAEFLTLVDSFRPSLIVMDLHLPDGDGVELLRMLVARGFKAPILIMSGVDERVLAAAHELGTQPGPQDVRHARKARAARRPADEARGGRSDETEPNTRSR